MPARRTLRQFEMAVNLLIASLSVFFLSAIVAVVLVGRRLPQPERIPVSLWIATICLAATSLVLELATRAAQHERQSALRGWILSAVALGLAFFAVQSLGLWVLCGQHLQAVTRSQSWILLFVLVALHSVHVLVGLITLVVVAIRACRGRFDHENHQGLSLTTRYWHFLDVVWLAVLGTSVYLLH